MVWIQGQPTSQTQPTKATKTNQRTLPPASPKVATTLIAAKASVGVKDVDGRTEATMKPGGWGGVVGLVNQKMKRKFGFSIFFAFFVESEW